MPSGRTLAPCAAHPSGIILQEDVRLVSRKLECPSSGLDLHESVRYQHANCEGVLALSAPWTGQRLRESRASVADDIDCTPPPMRMSTGLSN